VVITSTDMSPGIGADRLVGWVMANAVGVMMINSLGQW
jgi:hypothetical protein